MRVNIRQRGIVKNLNAYLSWHNLPFQVNKGGICNGLATVYAKYALEGRTKEFNRMLEYLAGELQPGPAMQDRVNHFVVEILLSFLPQQFDKTLAPRNSMQALQIDQKPLTSAFVMAIATSDSNWADIVNQIALQENEVMRVNSPTHTVAVSRIDGKYLIYDPNYTRGFRAFATPEELIRELHDNVFRYDKGPLGMKVDVIRHPNQPPRVFPNVCELYGQYLTEDTVNASAVRGNVEFKTLERAAVDGDAAIIEQLIGMGVTGLLEASFFAIGANNHQTLSVLLQYIEKKQDKYDLFAFALQQGRKEVFDELLKSTPFAEAYKTVISPKNVGPFIRDAAMGGNHYLLEKLLRDMSEQQTTFLIKKMGQNEEFKAGLREDDPAITEERIQELIDQSAKECTAADLSTSILDH